MRLYRMSAMMDSRPIYSQHVGLIKYMIEIVAGPKLGFSLL